jgi:Sigma-54 interaction domain
MAQPVIIASGVDPSLTQGAFAPQSNDQRHGSQSARAEHELARLNKVNLFAIGGDDVAATLVASLWPHLVTPVVTRHRGEPLRLPPASRPVWTIVLYGVDTLTTEEQHTLNQWLCARRGGTRIVSTASQSLLPLVEAGAFNDALYYRLNVVTLDLAAAVTSTIVK